MDHSLNAKKRNKKLPITDIAIQKVAYVKYKDFTEEQNNIMHQLAKDVLTIAKLYNNSNEVAITCDLNSENPLESYGISYGDEHSVDVYSDTLSNHIIVSGKSFTVVLLHNHPSTQTFSLDDIHFFLVNATIKVIVVVTNQGTVHYLYKDSAYDYQSSFDLFADCTQDITNKSTEKECYVAALTFLVRCSETGLFYS